MGVEVALSGGERGVDMIVVWYLLFRLGGFLVGRRGGGGVVVEGWM